MNRRFWTDAERDFVKQHYLKLSTGEVARKLGRSDRSVYQAAEKLGLVTRRRKATRADVNRIKALTDRGFCDTDIGEKLGFERHTISKIRRSLGLPCQGRSQRFVAKIKEATQRQLEAAGMESLAELRAEAWRKRAAERGWPIAVAGRPINHRHVQILDLLAERGPQTRMQIAEAVGMPWKGSRKSLVANGPGGSYLAQLMRAGLVVSLGRVIKGKGKGYSTEAYALALATERAARGE